MKNEFDALKLDNQLCFPLYAASKEIVRKYRPFLDELDLTYTQYITMLVLWEEDKQNVKDLGKRLYLDSGTLTPVLKYLESKGYVQRTRQPKDERNLVISLTEKGRHLKEKAISIPNKISQCVKLSQEDTVSLHRILYTILNEG